MILICHGQTEFNRVYSETRRDPGIRDPLLTIVGRSQAARVAPALRGMNPRRLIASPYTRALETAEIIAADLGLPISVEALIAERFAFTSDIGSPLAALRARWPDIAFDHLPDPWWPLRQESVEALSRRSEIFCSRIAREAWSGIAVVTHWGFIRAVTGLKVPNGAALRIDPTRLDRGANHFICRMLGEPPATGDPHGGRDDGQRCWRRTNHKPFRAAAANPQRPIHQGSVV